MKYRILAIGALTLLATASANATVYFDNTSAVSAGSDGPAADATTIMAGSFTAAASDFSSINILLSASNSADGGSALVYLVPDNGSGGSNGLAGAPTTENGLGAFTNFGGAQLVGTILDSSLSASPSLASLWVSPSITTQNNEYWLELAPTAGASLAWSFDSDGSGTGVANQAYINNFAGGNLLPANDTDGAYQFSVETPEPATIAILSGGLVGLGFFRRRKPNKAD